MGWQRRFHHFRRMAVLAAPLVVALACAPQHPAMALDLFTNHQVTVQFATADGKALANAEVRVFAPGDPTHVIRTGHTDSDGKFEFPADRDGLWTAEARTGGEVARATIRVGKPGGEDKDSEPLSPYYLIGALALLLALAIGVRVLRARARARRK
jgi:hypothetical protein